jgi:hypothetical protein
MTGEHIVTADGERVLLTLKEFELLRLFLSHPGMVFTRDSSSATSGAWIMTRERVGGRPHPLAAQKARRLRGFH